MLTAETTIKSLARRLGAHLVGITSREILSDGPPSANPGYLLSSANSVISFAVHLDEDLARDFISKTSWRPHCENRKVIGRLLYNIGDTLVEHLRSGGYEAINVDPNNNYRPEETAADVTEMTEFHPEFAHRYAALAGGIGRLGWSGNLLTAEYGALVELGSVITSAVLMPDDPIPDEEHPCDKCKMCSLVCPVEMVHPRASTQVTVAGVTETISQKGPNTRCWIGCTGYEGLAFSGTWSNWSPYRLGQPLPEDKQELDSLCTRLQKADPQMQGTDNSFNDYRQAIFDPDWYYYTVCGFCRLVCSTSRKERRANHQRIIQSGTTALNMDGTHVVAPQETLEVPTPFNLNVVVGKDELLHGHNKMGQWPGQFPLDREVIQHLLNPADKGEDKK